jgi:hypothetical protein
MDDVRNRSIGELLAALSRDTATLVRKELELARLEMSAIAADAARQAVWIAAGGLLAVIAVVGLLAALILALIGSGMSPAVAALVVSGATLVAGALLVLVGISALRRIHFVPVDTLDTLKRAPLWIRRKDPSHG